ncbi:MAG: hypothetical protein H0W30_08800 [Gemmatimonadaceae bacterium]|nr:hypothetical protein [Gemmatimonadaceae bacterium]MDQ3520240.1 hypothetical protein [Gemmatimonadota bacterium]
MTRFTLLPIAALVLVGACADTPSAPPSFERPSLDGLAPPPRIEARGSVSFTQDGGVAGFSAASVADAACVAPPISFTAVLDGTYFQNKPGTNAWAHFTAVGGSGQGKINETQNKQDASGILTIGGFDFSLIGWNPVLPLLSPTERNAGTATGDLEAEVRACGTTYSYTGEVTYSWGPITPPPCTGGPSDCPVIP